MINNQSVIYAGGVETIDKYSLIKTVNDKFIFMYANLDEIHEIEDFIRQIESQEVIVSENDFCDFEEERE